MQKDITVADLELVLALVRGRTLQEASRRIAVDPSTVFRAIRRLEANLGEKLFERGRNGYAPSELALELALSGERIEAEMTAARTVATANQSEPAGILRITTTDTVLQCLLLPLLGEFARRYPRVELELTAANEIANLSRRDADIAIRATRKPPAHLIGRQLGALRFGLFRASGYALTAPEQAAWIALDDSLPDHPSVRWRKKHYPKVVPAYRCNSMLAVGEAIRAGLGIGVVPLYVARPEAGFAAIGEPLHDIEAQLWLLLHPDVRRLQRVKVFADFLAARLRLP